MFSEFVKTLRPAVRASLDAVKLITRSHKEVTNYRLSTTIVGLTMTFAEDWGGVEGAAGAPNN